FSGVLPGVPRQRSEWTWFYSLTVRSGTSRDQQRWRLGKPDKPVFQQHGTSAVAGCADDQQGDQHLFQATRHDKLAHGSALEELQLAALIDPVICAIHGLAGLADDWP